MGDRSNAQAVLPLGPILTKYTKTMAKIVFKGPKFSIHDNKNVTCEGKEISNKEAERMLNKNFKV